MPAQTDLKARFVPAIIWLVFGVQVVFAGGAYAQDIIHTVAGGKLPSGPATSVVLSPTAVVTDKTGELLVADIISSSVYKVNKLGQIVLYAGSGAFGDGGDGRDAEDAQMGTTFGLAVDAAGNLFVADASNNRVRRVNAKTGIITTVAGNGVAGFSGDGGPATSAELNGLSGVAVDAKGNLFLADVSNNRIRRVDAKTGIITTVAGNGVAGFSGDGGPATSAELNGSSFLPSGLAFDTRDNLFVVDGGNNRIRRVDAKTGFIATVAGNGIAGFGGDGGPATSAQLGFIDDVVVDAAGNLFLTDSSRVRRVDAGTGIITTVAGGGFGGDGNPATSAALVQPVSIALDAAGNLFIADESDNRVRRVDASTDIITTAAGGGTIGNGGPADDASLNTPEGVAIDGAGNVFIADTFDFMIRRVDPKSGIITAAAGDGSAGFPGFGNGDGGPATAAQLGFPRDVAADKAGNLFIADELIDSVRRVDAQSGIITTVAGNGIPGFSGDGGPAIDAELLQPASVSVDASGNFFIADLGNDNIRRVDGKTGIITTVAGNGTPGFSGDGGLAVNAQLLLSFSSKIAVDSTGNLFISDTSNFRVRRVDAQTGIITTVAGNGMLGFSGDGGPATNAEVNGISGVGVDHHGNLFIAELFNERVRRVDAKTGIIRTVAGNGTAGFSGDGGPATGARLSLPFGLALDQAGDLFIAGEGDNRIREATRPTGTLTRLVSNHDPSESGDRLTFTAEVKPVETATEVPSGTVTFSDGPTTLGVAALDGKGVARFSTSGLTVGLHKIKAVYDGETEFTGSTASISQRVNP